MKSIFTLSLFLLAGCRTPDIDSDWGNNPAKDIESAATVERLRDQRFGKTNAIVPPEISTNLFPAGATPKPMSKTMSAKPLAQPLFEQPSPPPVTFLSKVNLAASWMPTPDEGAAGYNLYYGTLSRGYLDVIDAGTNLSAAIFNLDPGTKYYFAVTVYDHEGRESDFSQETAYIVPTWIQMTFLFPVQVHETKVQSSSNLLEWVDADTRVVSGGAQSLIVRAPIMSDPEFFRAVSVAP